MESYNQMQTEVNGLIIEHEWRNGNNREIKESDLDIIADMLKEGYLEGDISYYDDIDDTKNLGQWKLVK